jgi:tetratricopeptide (TPR) repeat protein
MGFLRSLFEEMDDGQPTTRTEPAYPKRPEDAFRKYLPGIRVESLVQAAKTMADWDLRRRYMAHCIQTFERLPEHYLEGRRLDKAGRIDEAIEFYEANASCFTIGDDMYERLRVIYQERGEYEEALRVCRAYLAMDDQYQQVVSRPLDWRSEARQYFEKWCAKLEAKLSRQDGE